MKSSHFTNSGLVLWGMKNDSKNKKGLKIFTRKRGGRRLREENRDKDRKRYQGKHHVKDASEVAWFPQ